MGKEISQELEQMISNRETICADASSSKKISMIENQQEELTAQVICPIICAGDAIGAVALLGRGEKNRMGEAEQKLVQTAAGFLGRQMEQ